MPDPEDTLRSTKHYTQNEREQIEQQGADERTRKPEHNTGGGHRKPARKPPKLGVNDEHETEEMQKRRLGTFP